MKKATVSDSKVSFAAPPHAFRKERDPGAGYEIFRISRSGRRLRDVVFAGEQMDQRALDCGLPGRRVDLCTKQIRHVEHVAGALAEGRDMGGGDIEVELRDRRRPLVQ